MHGLTRRLKQVDAGFLVVLAICLVAVWPFLSRAGLPQATDAELHVFRLAELGRLVRGGEWYPRWAPNFYFGYGYPIFNYYAPLAYYLALPLELLPWFDAVDAVKFIFVLTPLLGGIGMYGFVRDHWGAPAGYVAATSLVYAPYFQYVDPHARGDLAETLSLGLFPLALWAASRLRRHPSAGNWLVTLLLVAAVILSHNLMAMVFFALLLAWAGWQLVLTVQRRRHAQKQPVPWSIWLLFLVLLLGVGLAAFFWLPVALEQEAVNLSNLVGDGGHFDFRNHFLSPGDLLGPAAWLDWGATEAAFTLNLGLGQWLLATLGLGALLAGAARHAAHAAYFAIGALLLTFMMLPVSTPIWELVPLLPYMQFPWRLLGAAAPLLAVLAGVGIDALLEFRVATAATYKNGAGRGGASTTLTLFAQRFLSPRWLPAIFVAFLLLLALPLTLVPPWAEEEWDTSAQAVAAIERQGRWLGTTSTADFLPDTVETIPRPQDSLLADFEAGRPLDRVNRITLPEEAEVRTERLSPLHTRYYVSSPDDFLLRLFQFDFPGWVARIDGEPVTTELGRPEGFMVVPVPAGEHVVDVVFTDTAARRLAWLISAAAFLLGVAVAFVLWRVQLPEAPIQAPALPARSHGPLLLVVAILFVIAVLLPRTELLHYRSSGDVAIPAREDVYADFGGQIALIGFDAPAQARPGETLDVTLYWKAQGAVDINFQVFLHLLTPDGTIVAQSDKLHPGEFPTRRWPDDRYVRDVHRLSLPDDLAPGTYTISTGLWVQDEGWRLPLLDEEGAQVGDNYALQRLRVER